MNCRLYVLQTEGILMYIFELNINVVWLADDVT